MTLWEKHTFSHRRILKCILETGSFQLWNLSELDTIHLNMTEDLHADTYAVLFHPVFLKADFFFYPCGVINRFRSPRWSACKSSDPEVGGGATDLTRVPFISSNGRLNIGVGFPLTSDQSLTNEKVYLIKTRCQNTGRDELQNPFYMEVGVMAPGKNDMQDLWIFLLIFLHQQTLQE